MADENPYFERGRKLLETLMKESKGDKAEVASILTYANALLFAVTFYNGESSMTKEEWADAVAQIHLQAFLDIKPTSMGSHFN